MMKTNNEVSIVVKTKKKLKYKKYIIIKIGK